jgi:hypothetical protein
MDKVELLKIRMQEFRALLVAEVENNKSLSRELERLAPLFDEIEAGTVIPPCYDRFRNPFTVEDPRYGPTSALSQAGAEFRSALEDWPSQPWWQAAFGESKL